MRFLPLSLSVGAAICALLSVSVRAVEPEVAELSFDKKLEKAGAVEAAGAPGWITQVTQRGGGFFDDPRCWYVPGTEPKGAGRLVVTLDRAKINEDLAATILFDADDAADIAVQLFDAQGRVVEVDLFGNLVDVGKEATTDTFIIPLRKYPTADSIVLRRITGEVKVYGIVLLPVVTEGDPNPEALRKLADALGDPLSPENPLVKGIQKVAERAKVTIDPVKPAPVLPAEPAKDVKPPERVKYPAAVPPPAGAKIVAPPTRGLVGWWNFDDGTAADASGNGHAGTLRGGARLVPGVRGLSLLTRPNPSSARIMKWDSVTVAPTPDLALTDTLTVSAWLNYASIAPRWGSQVVWFGDAQYGRDPWCLHLYPDGTAAMRSDRSVTGKARFTVFGDELKFSPSGEPMPNQHVAAESPGTLLANQWYFVTGTIEKISPRRRALKLFVNGELVNEVTTEETVNYPTGQMAMVIGAVEDGKWQNFEGMIDDVRVYNRSLALSEIKTLYNQPWTRPLSSGN
jgi:Concanavalin A-like lectin/glucanases superfamily